MDVQYWEATMSCLWLIKGDYGQKDLLYQRNHLMDENKKKANKMRLYIIDILARILEMIIPLLREIVFLVLIEPKIMASMQHRRGPNIVGLFGLLHPLDSP
jgi:hypothetical protein